MAVNRKLNSLIFQFNRQKCLWPNKTCWNITHKYYYKTFYQAVSI